MSPEEAAAHPGSSYTSSDLTPDAGRGPRALPQISIVALLVGAALIRIGFAGVTVAVQLYLTDMAHGHPHGVTIGLIGAGESLSELICAPFMARWADRLGRKLFLVGGPIAGSLGVLVVAASVHPQQIFVARLIEGVAGAAFVPAALGAIAAATSHSITARARASGAFEASTLAGYAGGFVAGPFAYYYFGRGGFILLAVAYLAAGAVCLRFVAHIPPLPVTRLSTLVGAIVGPGPIRRFLPAWMGTWALLGAYVSNLPALLRHAPGGGQGLLHHLDPRLISVILVCAIALLVAGIILWTPWIARLGPARQMRRAVPGAWLFGCVLLIANHAPPPLTAVMLPLAGLGIVWLAGFGPAAVTYLANCSELFTADRTAMMAFYTVTLSAGGAIGAALGGVAVNLASLDGLVAFGLVLTLATFVLLGPMVRREQHPAQTVAAT